MRLRQERSEERCDGWGWTWASPVSAKELEAAPTASIVTAFAAASSTTVLRGSRLVGLVGEAPSARRDEERTAPIIRPQGYKRVITYTLASEGGASLRAVGATPTGPLDSHEWSNPNRLRKSQEVYHKQKFRWEL